MAAETSVLAQSPESTGRRVWIANIAAAGALGALVLLQMTRQNTLDLDVYHQMALTRAAIQLGHWPVEDLFAFTSKPGPSVHYEWGMGPILFFASKAGGGAALLILKYLLIAAMLAIAVRVSRAYGGAWAIIFVLLPAPILLLGLSFTTMRAGLLSLVFSAVLFFILEQDRRGKLTWIWFWIPLSIVWLNIHPGFIVGIGILVLYFIERIFRERRVRWHLVGIIVLMPVLMLINPYGILYPIAIARALLTMPLPPIPEWLPAWRFPSATFLAPYTITLIVAAYAIFRAGWRRCDGWLIVLIFGLASLQHVRHCYLYALAWMCYVPGWLSMTPLGEQISDNWKRHAYGIATVAAIVFACSIPALAKTRPWTLRLPVVLDSSKDADNSVVYPAGAVEYLKEQQFRGNVMTHYNDGSYVMWELWPKVKIGLDSRNDVGYAYPFIREILGFYKGGPGWRQTLNRYPSDLILIKRDLPLAGLMPDQHEWHRVYRDDAYELWARLGLDLPSVDRTGVPPHAEFP